MLKKVLIALGLVIFALICFVFYLINMFNFVHNSVRIENIPFFLVGIYQINPFI